MLFTKITDEKLQLELGILLDDERLEKVKIDANQEYIRRFVEKEGMNIMFTPKDSDFHIMIGAFVKLPNVEEAIAFQKFRLKQISARIFATLKELPNTPGKAIRHARNMKRFEELSKEFRTKAEKLLPIDERLVIAVCKKK